MLILNNNIHIRTLPKVGDKGLAIPAEKQSKDWEFDSTVAARMRREGIDWCWFQTFHRGEWQWNHGIVELKGNKAIITQIG